jgi:hypothetical protein
MNPLLADVLDSYGGIDRWRSFKRVSATIVTGGALWAMKGIDMDATPRVASSEFHRQWTSVDPFGDPDYRMVFVPKRVAIKTRAGVIVAQRDNPREAFAGHTLNTPWDPLHLGYFNGYAMWTYYAVPFVLAEPGFQLTEIAPITQDGQTLRGLRARFPSSIATHCADQSFYFGSDGLLRRHDYDVEILGGCPGAHMLSDYIEVQGLRFPTRCRVYVRGKDGRPQDLTTVSLDLSGYKLF